MSILFKMMVAGTLYASHVTRKRSTKGSFTSGQGNTVLVTYYVADVMEQGAGPELNLKILYRKHLRKQFGGINALLYKFSNLIHNTLTVLGICHAEPLRCGVKDLNCSGSVIDKLINHERNEVL